jgi:hypothetical protein
MQNLVVSDYFKRSKITPEMNESAYYLSQAEWVIPFDETSERLKVWGFIIDWISSGKEDRTTLIE